MKIQFLKLLSLLFLGLFLYSCSSDDSSDSPNPDDQSNNDGDPATEHTDDDKSTDNGNGTSTVTINGVDFDTQHRDFSGEPVVTDPKTISAALDQTYSYSNDVYYFRIKDDTLIGVLQIDNFNYQMVVHTLPNNTEISTHSTDFFISGFDYNGAIMTVEGSSDVNFYHVDKGVIGDHFFQIPAFMSTKTNGDCFMDENHGYVFNGQGLWVFELHDTDDLRKIADIPGFSKVRFSADESYIYVSVGTISGDSYLQILDKNDYTAADRIDFAGKYIEGMVVDANYIYMADSRGDRINVINKHTKADAGFINLTGVKNIDVVGDQLYAAVDGAAELRQYTISFN